MAVTEERIMSTTIAAAPQAGAAPKGDAKGAAAEGGAPKKSKKKLLVVAVLVLALGGGGAWFFLLRGGSSEPKAPEAGAVLALDSITINLADGRYLKLGMSLQLIKDVAEEPDGSLALDIAIDQLSGQPMARLVSTEGRRKAKERLVEEIEKAYDEEVMGVNLTEYVMQ